ncbi:APC family permease [Komagataeibacter sp. NFXK3]
MSGTSEPGCTKRKLGLIELLALSLAFISPTVVLCANGQALVGLTHVALWKVYGLGWIGISAIAYSFGRLASMGGHVGMADVAVGQVLGKRAGQFASLALLGAYASFSLANPNVTASFVSDIIHMLYPDMHITSYLPFFMLVLFFNLMIIRGQTNTIMHVLLAMEGVGIILIIYLCGAVLMQPHAAVAPTVVPAEPIRISSILSGVVIAFLSWAGFESCMTLSEENGHSPRVMHQALAASVIISGIMFVGVMAVIQYGFERHLGGLSALAVSSNALADMARHYIGRWSMVAFGFAALGSAFAGTVAAITACSNLARHVVSGSGSVLPASSAAFLSDHILSPFGITVLIVSQQFLLILLKPVMPALPSGGMDIYAFFGTVGAICIMISYLLVQLSALVAFYKQKSGAGWWEIMIALFGLVFIAAALFSCIYQDGRAALCALLAGMWMACGAMGFLFMSRWKNNFIFCRKIR